MNNNNTFQGFDDKLMYMYTQTRFYDEDDESSINGGELIQVIQHLEPEQYKFEFPSKMCLRELAYLDDLQDEYSYFDDSSFLLTALPSVTQQHQQQTSEYNMISHMNHSVWHETLVEEEEEEHLVEDNKLSPLQLPAQVSRPLSSSTESITQSEDQKQRLPVGPSSFLSDNMYKHVTQSQYIQKDYSFSDQDYSNDSVPVMDTDNDSSTTDSSSIRSSESRIVVIKLNKLKKTSSYVHSATSLTYISNDEGYVDGDDDELESHCVFYPLVENEDNEEYNECKRDSAAIKIQALWRGYQCRKNQKPSALNAEQRMIAKLAQFYDRFQRKQMNLVNEQVAQLKQKVREETAMRMAFEKAMEDMTVLIDQQQKILYDRLEQEVHMRQLYESKMNTALKQLQPLEARLKKEVVARNKMEEMMTRVLDQMHESETQRQNQAKEDAEYRKRMELKLETALNEIAAIKKSNIASTTNTISARQPRISSLQQQQKPVLNKTTSIKLTNANTSSTTTTTSLKKESITSKATTSVRKSIVPSTNSPASLRRQQPASPLYERPSVIPSNRRPIPPTKTIQNNSATTNKSRRPLLTRK